MEECCGLSQDPSEMLLGYECMSVIGDSPSEGWGRGMGETESDGTLTLNPETQNFGQ